MPVIAVRNRTSKIVSLSGKTIPEPIRWSPSSANDGEDVQQVDADLAKENKFARAVGLGILEVISDDEATEALRASIARQAALYQRGQQEEQSAMEAALAGVQGNTTIVITEDALNKHIEALSRSQASALSELGES